MKMSCASFSKNKSDMIEWAQVRLFKSRRACPAALPCSEDVLRRMHSFNAAAAASLEGAEPAAAAASAAATSSGRNSRAGRDTIETWWSSKAFGGTDEATAAALEDDVRSQGRRSRSASPAPAAMDLES